MYIFQGCSVCFLVLMFNEVVKVLEPLSVLSNLMCSFGNEGFLLAFVVILLQSIFILS
jgi:hypothetical protein